MTTNISVINDIKITVDPVTGKTHFEPIDQPKPNIQYIDDRSIWQKISDWWSNTNVKPYITKRNLSDPFGDKQYEGGTHSAWEAGIKISF